MSELWNRLGNAMTASADVMMEKWRVDTDKAEQKNLQEFRSAEANKSRDFQSSENQKGRDQRSSESEATQQHRSDVLDAGTKRDAKTDSFRQQQLDQKATDQEQDAARNTKAMELLDTQIESANLSNAKTKAVDAIVTQIAELDPGDEDYTSDSKAMQGALRAHGVKIPMESFSFLTRKSGEYGESEEIIRTNKNTGEASVVDLQGSGGMTSQEQHLKNNPDLWEQYESKYGALPSWFQKP